MGKVLRRRRFWLGVFISLIFLYLAFRSQNLGEIEEKVRSANYWWLFPAVGVYFLAVAARTLRWQVLLGPVRRIPSPRLFPVVVIGYAGNNVFPLRAGEFIRAFLLGHKEAVSASTALATIVMERIFDGITMILFVLLALGFVALSSALRQLVMLMSILFFGALIAFFLVASSPARSARLYEWGVGRLVPAHFRESIIEILDHFLEGLQVLRSGRQVLATFLLSLVLWLLEVVKYYFVMEGFAFRCPFYGLMLTTAVVNLATSIPATPGYLGTFEMAGIASLKLFGLSPEMAASFMLVLHAALYFPITILGLALMWREGISWLEIEKLREKASGVSQGGRACASGSSAEG